MRDALNVVISILIVFTAIGLVCAVSLARRRDVLSDPFSNPFGEMPGFTPEQLLSWHLARDPAAPRIFPIHRSAGLALRPDAGSGRRSIPSSPAAARVSWWRKQHA